MSRFGLYDHRLLDRCATSRALAVALLLSSIIAPLYAQEVPHEDDLPLASLVPVLELETSEAPLAQPVYHLAESDEGAVFAANLTEILIFDSDGAYIGEMGRAGQGPGEFQFITGLGLHGDTLWVADAALGRVTRLLPNGRVLETISPRPPGALTFGQITLAPDRSIVMSGSVTARMGPPEDPTGRHRTYWRRWRGDDQALDTLVVSEVGNEFMMVPGYGGTPRPIMQPFAERSPAAFDGTEPYAVAARASREGVDGLIVVERISFDGVLDTALAVRYRPRPVTQATIDSVVHLESRMISGRPGAGAPPDEPLPEIVREMRRTMYLPEHHPPLWDLVQGEDGVVWIGREASAAGRVRWLIANIATGAQAIVELDQVQRPMAATDGYVWLQDGSTALGVPRTVKYRIDVPD